MDIIAQSTQPVLPWIWTNLSTGELLAAFATFGVVAAAFLAGLNKLILLLIGYIFGWKSAIKREQEKLRESVTVLAQASSVSSTPVTDEVKAKVELIAQG